MKTLQQGSEAGRGQGSVRRIAVTAVPVLTAGLLLAGCNEEKKAAAPEPQPVRVETVRLEPADQLLRYAAVIRPRIEADIGFRVGGKMMERLVEVGDRVQPGTVIARLDPQDLDLQAHAAVAQLAAAEADAANTRNDLKRASELLQGQWLTKQEYDRRKALSDSAEARVRQIRAQLDVTRNSARYATLVADTGGVVTAVLAEPGQVVAQGQAVVRVAKGGEVEAVASIPEQQVVQIRDADLKIELWALPGVSIAGHLRELSPSADNATRTFQARITLANPPPDIQLGMTATVIAARAETGSVARLPMAALTKQGTEPAVWVLNRGGDGVVLKPVQVAAYAGDRVLLSGGVVDGDRIVTAGVQKLHPASKVRAWTDPVR